MLSLEPNPLTGNLKLSIKKVITKKVVLCIYDVYGKLIFKQEELNTQPLFNSTIDLHDIAPGVYFFVALLDGVPVSRKIIKN